MQTANNDRQSLAPLGTQPETQPDAPAKRVKVAHRPNSRYVDAVNRPEGGTRYDLKPPGLDLIATCAAGGLSDADIAARLGLSPSAFVALKKRDPRVPDALRQGVGSLESECVGELLKSVRDGNIVAAMFLLKSKCGYRDQGPTDPNAGNGTTVNIHLTSPLSPDDFLKVVGPLPPELES